jgi:2-dehydro-3-deoxy-L-rhamnonate dehydrogenase (NAD+)
MQRALVTGGASGIGAACAQVLEREGWDVVRADLQDGPGVRRLDVTDEAAWDALIAELGPLDGLVSSAGIRTRSMIVDTSLDEWERHLRVNVTGTWLAIRSFLRAIPPDDERQRAIVTIASVNATMAVPGSGALRRVEGCDRCAHPCRRARGCTARRPRQRHRAGPDPDADGR